MLCKFCIYRFRLLIHFDTTVTCLYTVYSFLYLLTHHISNPSYILHRSTNPNALLSLPQALARSCLRVQKLGFFGEYLLGLEEPLLKWNAARQCLEALPTEGEEGAPLEGDTYTRQRSNVRIPWRQTKAFGLTGVFSYLRLSLV